MRGTGGVSQPEKHLSCRRRRDQTNQRRLENMISRERNVRAEAQRLHTVYAVQREGINGISAVGCGDDSRGPQLARAGAKGPLGARQTFQVVQNFKG